MSDGPRILLVEDSATQALQVGAQLERGGMRVDYARDAAEAVAMIEQHPPDLVVLDYLLPGTTGDELSRRIRLNAGTRTVPILMLTGSGDVNIERRSLEAGVDDYLPKGEHESVLLLRIQALLRRHRIQVGSLLQAASRTPRILAVDDSPTYLEMVREALASEGYAVDTATTGEGCMEKLARGRFDAVVLDLHLPDVDGLELCGRVARTTGKLDERAVLLVLTGEEDPDLVARTLAEGADDAVHKSRDMAIVKARLGAMLRRKFAYEEHQLVIREFQERERQLLRAETARAAAEEKAALASELEKANRELKETQSQLVQSAKMASLGALVAGVAHEINNPLGFVMSHIGTVERGLNAACGVAEESLSGEAHKRIDKAQARIADVRDGLERIKELVTKLRTFSRLDEGAVKQVDVHENLESVLTLLGHRLKHGIEVTRDYCDGGLAECQPGPLNQVWMNLLSNAIDAVGERGRISLVTRRNEDLLTVTIRDSGTGMPESVKERIFEPFYTTKGQDQGTGLGLSISYGIVRAHGGRISVESEPGKGARFAVSIPTVARGNSAQS